MGRGEEVLGALKVLDENNKNYQNGEKEIIRISILIDMRRYEEASDLIKIFDDDEWDFTFTKRKVINCKLRLLNEFKKNLPKKYEATENVSILNLKNNYKSII